jgi:hypothetical protein
MNFGDKRTGCCITTTHTLTTFFTREFLNVNNMTVVPHPPIFSFPRLKIKLKDRHFDTIEVIEPEFAGGAEHPHRTRLSGCIYRVVEVLGTVHKCGRRLLPSH